jgi:succinate dehydrogenase/fumarate reductase cytochrome b subunit
MHGVQRFAGLPGTVVERMVSELVNEMTAFALQHVQALALTPEGIIQPAGLTAPLTFVLGSEAPSDTAGRIFITIVFAILIACIVISTIQSLRSGKIRTGTARSSGTYSRKERPAMFWITIILGWIFAMAFIIAGFSLLRGM